MPYRPKNLARLMGVQTDTTSHKEKMISAAGGFAGILLVLFITSLFVPGVSGAMIVASMGASAVLLYAVPHGPLSQPWPLLGGHVLSAIIGVTMRIWIPDIFLAGGLAVGLSIATMFYLRCIHPPGGATALAAVVSGPAVYALGYQFVLTPVLLNAVLIIVIGMIINFPFAWRRYPFALTPILLEKKTETESRRKQRNVIPRSDLEYALREMRSFADVSEEELEKIYATAKRHGEKQKLKPEDIRLGSYYSHGQYDDQLTVRRIIDESRHENPEKDMVIYKVVSGADLYKTGTATRAAFARWARHEVILDGKNWHDLDGNDTG
ncbi:MAG: rane protein, partial [Pseudomonadota bacterium]|nr:rane protein [Pseudomonadota bacterium]